VGGSQLIADKVAAILGNRIVLNSPVRRIDRGTSGVTVVSDQMTVTAKRVIVAVPPTLAGRIDYQPILPFEREQLMQRYNQGTLTKVAAVYNRPFWRDAGLSGTALDTGGPVSATFDDSPPSGSPGVVFGFVGGDKAREYNAASPSDRSAAVLSQFATFFGDQAKNPTAYSKPTGAASNGRAGARSGSRAWAPCWPTAPGSEPPSTASTGPGPRR
jgi:monoamine oxidase